MKNKSLNRLYKLMKPHIKKIIVITIIAILIDLIEIFKPYLIKIIIDDFLNKGITKKGFWSVNIIGVIYILAVTIGNVLDYYSRMKTNIVGEEVIFNLRNNIYEYAQKANIKFHDKMPSGKLYARIINDVEDIGYLFKEVIVTIFKDIILIINIMGIMIYISFKLSLLSFIVFPFVIILSIVLTNILNKLYDLAKIARTNLNTFLAESIYGAKVIKTFNIQKEKQEECEKYTKDLLEKRLKTSIYEALFPYSIILFENIVITIIVCAVLYKWLGISVEVGVVYIFINYAKALFEPVNRTVDNIEVVQDAIVSINKIYDILDRREMVENFDDGIIPKKTTGKLEFKHVWFAYEGENWILKDINFVIEPGETIALVGRTGSGKTTITNLVNRFYDIQKGEILLDGINIKDINKEYLRNKVGVVLQDPFIFAKTIKENIKLNSQISDENIVKALKDASAYDFVSSLPNGIEEVAKERGESFSAGQKQLIAFARIFAHNPDIFIMDEATANIDTNTEKLIQKSIDILSKQKTAIFIAHRLSTIVNVDKILVINNGEIIEEGNHKDLLEKDGYYSKLYKSYYESLG